VRIAKGGMITFINVPHCGDWLSRTARWVTEAVTRRSIEVGGQVRQFFGAAIG
jgi:hypothetical protein